ncbi:MAG: exodeoxyribonuclease VII large subunit [Lentisphaerae bacterium]|nr:exodeoxyribonuclease VII large subunit [Lentisphaerota bacterium]
MNQSEPIWSVTAVNQAIKETLEGAFMPFWMGGEVGSLLLHRSGHAYFQMKDEKCQIKVCWFGGAAQCRSLGVDNGTLVEVWGNLSVYDVRGEYQFNVKKLRLAGIGALQQRFEMLKNKLAAEGLFDQSRKKAIPALPRKIGVVTSPEGAAIRDFLQILSRRFPNVQVNIYPAPVQGAGAAEKLADGIKFFNRSGQADVIVITRGGGSMEDLWCFNEEVLARAVADSEIPVISAVGHEIDFTICDFAADMRVPTPSAAAELVIGQHDDISTRIDRAAKDMLNILRTRSAGICAELEKLSARAAYFDPVRQLNMLRQRIDELEIRSDAAVKMAFNSKKSCLDTLDTALKAFDPRNQLERGYAMIFDPSGKKVISTSKLPPDTEIRIRFADGTVGAKTL